MSRLSARAKIADTLLDEGRGLSADFDKLSQVVSERIGIGPRELVALELIGRDQAVTAGHLARELNLTTGAITSLVDRLEKAGFARRASDASDRRRVLVVATQKQQQLQALFRPLDSSLRRTLETYSDAELVKLTDFVRRVRSAVSAATEGMRNASDRLIGGRPTGHNSRRRTR